jgi:hypothetical protein
MWYTFEGVVHADTPKAIFFQSHYWEEGMWLPKSQLKIEADGDFFHLVKVRNWLMKKNNMFEFHFYPLEFMEAVNASY